MGEIAGDEGAARRIRGMASSDTGRGMTQRGQQTKILRMPPERHENPPRPNDPRHRGAARREVAAAAWPIVVANASVPLVGLVDTAVIGNTGTTDELGAIALGVLIFNFLYWGFGFLRMGTTGFTAQASGAGDDPEIRATLGRALLLATGLGVGLILLRHPTGAVALRLLGADPATEAYAASYFSIRIWGAPASLGIFAVLGSFVGLGRTDHLLRTQLFLNGLNAALDFLLAGVLEMGVRGIALGTVIAEWATLGLCLAVATSIMRDRTREGEALWPWGRMREPGRLLRTLGANGNIMVRTLFLVMGFAWFTNQGARLGTEILAANHILLQIVSLSAYLLDGVANATETLVGRAFGTGSRAAFDRATRAATELAGITAALLGLAVLLLGPATVSVVTDLPAVRALAGRYLPWTAAYVTASFAAFQLDGIFIGATGTKAMRNASILAFVAFYTASRLLTPVAGNEGLWLAFLLYVIVRAVALGLFYPKLRRSVAT